MSQIDDKYKDIDLDDYPEFVEDKEAAADNDEEPLEEDMAQVGGKLKALGPFLIGGFITVFLIIAIVFAIGSFAQKKNNDKEDNADKISASVNDTSQVSSSGNDVMLIYVSANDGETATFEENYVGDETDPETSDSQTTQEEDESPTVADTTTTVAPAVLNHEFLDSADYEEITSLISEYVDAYAACDLSRILSLVDYNGGTQITQETLDERAEIVEGYQDLECYIVDGMNTGSYVVYVSYNIKFYNIDTPAPTLTRFYVITSDDGSLYIYNGEVTSKLNAYLNTVNDYDCVNELSESINAALKEACEADETLKTLMEILYGSDES